MATTTLNKKKEAMYASLLAQRLNAQLLTDHDIQTPQALVQKMGAMQAQHFEMVHWAIGMRLQPGQGQGNGQLANKHKNASMTQKEIQLAINKGEIVRTHALRPTWHFLAGEDLLWILALTGPAIKKVIFSRDKHLGIIEKEYAQSDKVIHRILDDQAYLTRQELIAGLVEAGLTMDEYRSNHYIMHAELNGIICGGPVKNGKHSYSLSENALGKCYDKAIRLKNKFQGASGVYELARRYFSTRGPASLQDFSWWSGLSLTAIKKAVSGFGDALEKRTIEQGDFYHLAATKRLLTPKENDWINGVQLLPAFDEYLISYKDRTHLLDNTFRSEIITSNGLFRPAIIARGKVIGGWQQLKGKNGLQIQLTSFETLKKAEQKKLLVAAESAAMAYCAFKELPLESIHFV